MESHFIVFSNHLATHSFLKFLNLFETKATAGPEYTRLTFPATTRFSLRSPGAQHRTLPPGRQRGSKKCSRSPRGRRVSPLRKQCAVCLPPHFDCHILQPPGPLGFSTISKSAFNAATFETKNTRMVQETYKLLVSWSRLSASLPQWHSTLLTSPLIAYTRPKLHQACWPQSPLTWTPISTNWITCSTHRLQSRPWIICKRAFTPAPSRSLP